MAQVFMGISFLLATLAHMHRTGVMVWKASSLVPLRTSMEGWDVSELQAGSGSGLDKRAESRYVWILGPGYIEHISSQACMNWFRSSREL